MRERDGIVGVFHELHPDPIFCTRQEWEKLVAGVTGGGKVLTSALKQRKLIIGRPDEDDAELKKTTSFLERKLNQPTTLYLMTAQGCNFGCEYCPVPGIARKHGEVFLSKEDAFAGIDLWMEHLKDVHDSRLEYFVIFYGGEPLLNMEVIGESLAYLRIKRDVEGLPHNLNFMVATNGVLLTDDFIALCREYGVMVAVGLDGPKELNDALRVDKYGSGTFDSIVEAIGKLIHGGIRTFASVSVTPHNAHRIVEYGPFFKKLGIEKFGFNFLKGRLMLKLVGQDGLDAYYRKVSRGIIEQNRRGTPGFEYQMEKKQAVFDRQEYFPPDCTCYGNQLVVQPDGQLSNCPFYKARLGHVREVGDAFRIWSQPIVTEWRKRLSLDLPGEAKALSGGGCAWSSVELSGNPLVADDSSRIFAEEALNELIWSRYDR